jgi:putative transcriptional regulator
MSYFGGIVLTPAISKVKQMIRQPENFPEQVRDVRRQLQLSQEELAHALGVSFATVNRWENGKTTPSKLAQRQFEQFCKLKKDQGELACE